MSLVVSERPVLSFSFLRFRLLSFCSETPDHDNSATCANHYTTPTHVYSRKLPTMSDTGARVAHRRMMKVVKLEAREEVAYPSQQSLGASGTMASAQSTSSPSPTSAPVVSALPVSTAAIAGVGAFLVLLVILGAWRRDVDYKNPGS